MELLHTKSKNIEVEEEQPKDVFKETMEKIKKKKEKDEKKLQTRKEEEEIRNLMLQEKLEQLSEEDIARIKEIQAQGLGVNLSSLTSNPIPEDVLLFALPVCAPYDSLKDYKYKVKLVPGTMKKGKAARICINMFLNNPDITDRERELIKALSEEELTLTMISNCKVASPGMKNK